MTTNLLPVTPTWLKFFYKIFGIVQFPCTTTSTSAKIFARLYCTLSYVYFINFIFQYDDYYYEAKVLRYVYVLVYYGNVSYMFIFVLILFIRSDKIKAALSPLREIDIPIEETKRTSLRIVLIVSYVPALCFYFPFRKMNVFRVFYFLYPTIVSIFDLLFMSDVMDGFCDKFGGVNRQLQRMVDEADLNGDLIQKL